MPPVGVDVGLVAVVVGVLLPDLGRYLIPVEGQSELVPDGATGMNSPVATEPFTSYEYQISSSALELHCMVAE